ncbi:MAG: Tm-1-like ATP-binding domain-containing protein [Acidobacteria bacterium]|nr:Tm-1-like ATP-binding domain-containing protein [Acidobacteriota bacterium]
MANIALIAALDTKGEEAAFVAAELERRGHRPLVIDVGVLGRPASPPAVTRDEVATAGGASLAALVAAADRGAAVARMADGAAAVLAARFAAGQVDAVIGLGGGAGTSIATRAMRELPIGVPKVMVSTLAGGDVSGFVGQSDIVMVPSIVDISGLNRISRDVFTRAAAAVAAMAEAKADAGAGTDRRLLAATMFGNTTACVEAARAQLERSGYEVLVFHATGAGGRTMEGLVRAGYVAGVLDVTTTEWADQLVGGVMAAGGQRLEAAARAGVPAVVVPGCLDMVNFWAPDTVPAAFTGRRFYQHAPNVTLMRTTPGENARLGEILATKLNMSIGPVAVFLPLRGLSVISAEGGPFHWPEADAALFQSIRSHLRSGIELHELDCTINDPVFASAMATRLLEMLAGQGQTEG